ncbi:RidA family protein [Pseudodonghicola flavimaris]|uniref:RidA family protein n=1 Tax=Pseudodonghicola flavimaris TaxID=3050036 RepID=A0ABT7F2R6_9RHOB|nr:RidA family protein [Pseudodonghicola flavimaris]MDK3018891.1 RidA family protein [Pseudodonghicola flavimaris]
MTELKRLDPAPRMSQAVIHGDTVYTAGQVALGAPGAPVAAQTQDILGKIDALLETAGSSKEKLISATIWLADIATFAEMNEVWDAWVAPGAAPCRACVESKLAAPDFTVEIQVIAGL